MNALQMTVPMRFGNVRFVGIQSLGSCLGVGKGAGDDEAAGLPKTYPNTLA